MEMPPLPALSSGQDARYQCLSSAVTLDSPSPSLTRRLEPIYNSDEDSPPLAKCFQCACRNQIMVLPTDHWDEEDLVDIYSLEAGSDNDGFVWMSLSVLHSMIDPHDSLMAALAPTVHNYIDMCGSVCYAMKIIATALSVCMSMRNFRIIGYLTWVLQCTSHLIEMPLQLIISLVKMSACQCKWLLLLLLWKERNHSVVMDQQPKVLP